MSVRPITNPLTTGSARAVLLPGRLLVAAVVLLMVATSCTYSKESSVGLPERFENPDGPLAFADESLRADDWVVVNTDIGLNLRADATVSSDSLARLAQGETVSSTGHVTDVDGVRWIEVRWQQNIGWVHSGYLAPVGSLESLPESPFATDSPSSDPTEIADAQVTAGETLVVTGIASGVNLRKQPDGDVIMNIVPLAEVTATGSSQGQWIEVTYDDAIGWVYSEFVIPLRPDAQAAEPKIGDGDVDQESGPTGSAMVYVDDTDGLNVRTAPNGTIVDRLISGTVVVLTGNVADQWAEITFDNRTGWVSTQYLIEVVGDPSDRASAITEGVTVTNAPGSIGVNVRGEPNGEIIVTIPDGSYATLTGNRTDHWAELEYEGQTGWAFIELLLLVEIEE